MITILARMTSLVKIAQVDRWLDRETRCCSVRDDVITCKTRLDTDDNDDNNNNTNSISGEMRLPPTT